MPNKFTPHTGKKLSERENGKGEMRMNFYAGEKGKLVDLHSPDIFSQSKVWFWSFGMRNCTYNQPIFSKPITILTPPISIRTKKNFVCFIWIFFRLFLPTGNCERRVLWVEFAMEKKNFFFSFFVRRNDLKMPQQCRMLDRNPLCSLRKWISAISSLKFRRYLRKSARIQMPKSNRLFAFHSRALIESSHRTVRGWMKRNRKLECKKN